jgi:hypothetical protein
MRQVSRWILWGLRTRENAATTTEHATRNRTTRVRMAQDGSMWLLLGVLEWVQR